MTLCKSGDHPDVWGVRIVTPVRQINNSFKSFLSIDEVKVAFALLFLFEMQIDVDLFDIRVVRRAARARKQIPLKPT